MKTIRELRDAIDMRPGLPHWESAVRCYAVDILEAYTLDTGRSIWDEIPDITESDLLDGASDWQRYSSDGFSLIWTQDIAMRFFGFGPCPLSPQQLMVLQGIALAQAAGFILNMLKQKGDMDHGLVWYQLPG